MVSAPHLRRRGRASLCLWLRYRAARTPKRADPYNIARLDTWRAECNNRAAAALNDLGGMAAEW